MNTQSVHHQQPASWGHIPLHPNRPAGTGVATHGSNHHQPSTHPNLINLRAAQKQRWINRVRASQAHGSHHPQGEGEGEEEEEYNHLQAYRNRQNNMLERRHGYHEGKTQYHKGMHDYHAGKLQYYQMRAQQHWNPLKRIAAQFKMAKHQQAMRMHYNLGMRQSMKARKRMLQQTKLDAQRHLQNLGPNPVPRAKGSPFWFPH